MSKKQRSSKLPSELVWLNKESTVISHTAFFDFFKSYPRSTAIRRFKNLVLCIQDNHQRAQILEDYSKWKKTKAAKNYWAERENAQTQPIHAISNESASTSGTPSVTTSSGTPSVATASSSRSSFNSVETISVEEAKDLIRGHCTSMGTNDANDLPKSFFAFKNATFNSITPSTLLNYESNLQQLLCLSNVLLIGKYAYDAKLDDYFDTLKIETVRLNAYQDLQFSSSKEQISKETMISLITIINRLNGGLLSRFNAVKSIINLVSDDMDPTLFKIMMCIKALAEALPFQPQHKKVMENELCTRNLQPIFQNLFDSEDGNKLLFKWTNTINFTQDPNDEQPVTKNRPDGCVEDSHSTIGFVEVKPIGHASNHKKVNVDIHRLAIFGKTALAKYHLAKSFQIMAIGTNLQFYICQYIDGICIMTELDAIRFPVSLDELPQLIPYMDRLYNVVETIYKNCYAKDNKVATSTATSTNNSDSTLEAKVLKAITEKTVDRARPNSYYHPCH